MVKLLQRANDVIQLRIGNLFNATETYICHQTNCVTNISAHLAKDMFERFPHADIYIGRQHPDVPGTIIIRGEWGEPERLVINMLAQYYPGCSKYRHSKKDGNTARLSYFNNCLDSMVELKGSFAFPWRIGCGAAGGDWNRYLDELLKFSLRVEGDVVIYKLPEG